VTENFMWKIKWVSSKIKILKDDKIEET
jgi:hypothetical protein